MKNNHSYKKSRATFIRDSFREKDASETRYIPTFICLLSLPCILHADIFAMGFWKFVDLENLRIFCKGDFETLGISCKGIFPFATHRESLFNMTICRAARCIRYSNICWWYFSASSCSIVSSHKKKWRGMIEKKMGRGAGRFSLLRLLLPLCHYGHFTETMTVKTQRFVTLKPPVERE